MRVVGLQSGTSFDAVDVAVADLDLDGDEVVLRPVGARSTPYPGDVHERLREAMPPAAVTAADVCWLDTRIGQFFAETAEVAVAELAGGTADLVCSHGQTLYHWVEDGRAHGTLQLGQPAWIAERTGLPVVADLRARDVAAGGHGAPLASTLDVLLLERDAPEPRAALNLGGIANLTVVGGARDPVAFDTGPANALIDLAAARVSGGGLRYDEDGRIAARGAVDEALLDRLLADPYYELDPPKSTGKERFHRGYLDGQLTGREVDADVVATLTALTAETVARACQRWSVREVIGSGGGMANPTLLRMLRERLGEEITLRPIDELGLPADSKEAYLFALLGFLTVNGLPGTVPSCTGARHAAVLGAVVPGAAGSPLLGAGASSDDPPRLPGRLRIEVAP